MIPSGEHQHGRVALERAREHFGTLDAKADAVIFDGRESGLWNARALQRVSLL